MATIIKLILSVLLVLSCSACKSEVEPNIDYQEDTYRHLVLEGKEYKYNSHLVNFLVIGTDTSNDDIGQSDFIGLLSFDRENEEINFLMLSRNAYVPIKVFDVSGEFIDWSNNHLALSYAYGKDAKSASYLTSDAVSRLLNDIPIRYITSFNLNGIEDIHDVVGTLDVVIPDDSLVFSNPSWTKGTTITLTSDNVESFVRTRDIKEDFTNVNRMLRQKTYLLAYVDTVKTLLNEDFDKHALKLEKVLSNSFTNFDLSEVEAFADMLMTYKWNTDSFYELPGNEEVGSFHDRFIVDEEALIYLVRDLFYIEK